MDLKSICTDLMISARLRRELRIFYAISLLAILRRSTCFANTDAGKEKLANGDALEFPALGEPILLGEFNGTNVHGLSIYEHLLAVALDATTKIYRILGGKPLSNDSADNHQIYLEAVAEHWHGKNSLIFGEKNRLKDFYLLNYTTYFFCVPTECQLCHVGLPGDDARAITDGDCTSYLPIEEGSTQIVGMKASVVNGGRFIVRVVRVEGVPSIYAFENG